MNDKRDQDGVFLWSLQAGFADAEADAGIERLDGGSLPADGLFLRWGWRDGQWPTDTGEVELDAERVECGGALLGGGRVYRILFLQCSGTDFVEESVSNADVKREYRIGFTGCELDL